MKFHTLLKHKRFDIGCGLREFAERCGILPSWYANIEHGRQPASWSDLLKIFRALGMEDAAWLAEEWTKPFTPEPLLDLSRFIPVFLKTSDGKPLTGDEAKAIVERFNQ